MDATARTPFRRWAALACVLSIARGRAGAAALAILLSVPGLGAAWAQEGLGRLRTTSHAPLPELRTVEIRPIDAREPNRHVEALLAEEMRGRGYTVELGAALVLGYRATGVFSQLKGDNSWLRLQGRIGSSSEPQGTLAIAIPEFGAKESAARSYAIELRAEDQPGTRFWDGFAVIESKSEAPAQMARVLAQALLERLGRDDAGPVIR